MPTRVGPTHINHFVPLIDKRLSDDVAIVSNAEEGVVGVDSGPTGDKDQQVVDR